MASNFRACDRDQAFLLRRTCATGCRAATWPGCHAGSVAASGQDILAIGGVSVGWVLAWSAGLPAMPTIWPRLLTSNGAVAVAPGRPMVVKGPLAPLASGNPRMVVGGDQVRAELAAAAARTARSAKNADRPMHQSRDAHLAARPLGVAQVRGERHGT
jgi:hypothetical protein